MANSKITALTAVTLITDTDLAVVVADMPTTPVTKKIVASDLLNGWISAATWTYASASTFTIAGDYTGVYKLGTRLRWTQTTVKYGVVLSSSYGAPNTTVTIAVNTDYVVANAAITAQAYSYLTSPLGWPGWFAFTPSWTNLTAGDGTAVAAYAIVDKILFMTMSFTLGSTSSISGAVSFTAPVTAATTSAGGLCRFFDANVGSVPGSAFLSATNAVKVRAINSAGTYLAEADVSSTVPFTWTTTDNIVLSMWYRLV